jgi:hypothetical protein
MKFSKKSIILFGKVLKISLDFYIVNKFYPLCEKYPNDYDLGKQIRKLSILETKNSYPNDGDLGSYARKMVNNIFE